MTIPQLPPGPADYTNTENLPTGEADANAAAPSDHFLAMAKKLQENMAKFTPVTTEPGPRFSAINDQQQPAADDIPNSPEAFRDRLLQLTEKTAKLEKAAVKKPDNDAASLRAALREKESLVERLSLQNNPKFERHFKDKLGVVEKVISDLLPPGAEDHLAVITSLPKTSSIRREIIESLTSDLSADDARKIQFLTALQTYDSTVAEREAALANAKEHLEVNAKREAEAREVEERADQQRRAMLAQKVLQTAARAYPESFSMKHNDDAHNKFVTESRQLVEDFFSGKMSDSTASTLPLLAAEAKRYQRIVPKMTEELRELREALSALRGAAPTPGSRPTSQAPETPKGFVENVMALWPKT